MASDDSMFLALGLGLLGAWALTRMHQANTHKGAASPVNASGVLGATGNFARSDRAAPVNAPQSTGDFSRMDRADASPLQTSGDFARLDRAAEVTTDTPDVDPAYRYDFAGVAA